MIYRFDSCPDFQTSVKRNLYFHKLGKHSKISRLSLCEEEGCTFKTKRDSSILRMHVEAKHEGIIRFKCDQMNCSYGSYFIAGVKNHMKIHSAKIRFSCEECTKSFTQNKNLRRHIKGHSVVKPYGCDQCTKTFINSTKLNSHIQTH